MPKVTYPGIDYSSGRSNVNHKNGIHYGIINQSEVLQAWADSSEGDYGMPICPDCSYEFKKSKNPVKCPNCGFRPQDDSLFYRDEPLAFYYNQDGYRIVQHGDDTDLFITQSPFFTYAQFCSPCAPGAGYLMNWMDQKDGGIPTYCLGHDWFESQETGKWIDCPYCKGTGIRYISQIGKHFNRETFIANGGKVIDDNKVECWACNHNRPNQIGKVKEMIHKAPYPVYSVKTGKLIEPVIE